MLSYARCSFTLVIVITLSVLRQCHLQTCISVLAICCLSLPTPHTYINWVIFSLPSLINHLKIPPVEKQH